MNIALVSPNEDGLSETFIKAHRDLLDGNVRHYYWGLVPEFLEGRILSRGLSKVFYRIYGRIFLKEGYYDIRRAFQNSLKREKIDVALAEYGTTGAECMPLCRDAVIPLVVHFHGRDATARELIESYRDKFSEMFKYASAIIAVSNKMKSDLIKLGADSEKIILAPYGPADDFFDLKPPVGACQHLVGIGRFVDKKAPYYTILAFKEVLEEFPDATLTLAGDGPLLPSCRNLVKYLNIGHAVKFPGALKHDEVKALFSTASAFVQHSIEAEDGDCEGTPVAVLEACASGLPVIATRHAGIPDVVVEDKTGLLVDEHDVAGMTCHMRHLLRDPALARALGSAGRMHIQNNFNIGHHIGILNNVIMSIVGND